MGNILMLISAFCFALNSYYSRIVTTTSDMTSTMSSFSRFLLGAIFIGGYLLIKKKSIKLNNYKTVFMRAILNCASIIIFSWALNFTTITNVNMLNMTYPIVVVLLVPLISKEKIKKSTYIYLALVVIGAYAIINPSFDNINIGDFAALSTSITSGLSVFALKEAIKHDDGTVIVFYVMLLGMLIDLPLVYKDLQYFDVNGLVPILLSGLFGLFGQLTQTWSFKTLDSATGSLISTSRIIISAAIGIILLSEPINFRIIIGMILIIISLVGVSGYIEKIREERQKSLVSDYTTK